MVLCSNCNKEIEEDKYEEHLSTHKKEDQNQNEDDDGFGDQNENEEPAEEENKEEDEKQKKALGGRKRKLVNYQHEEKQSDGKGWDSNNDWYGNSNNNDF